MKFYRLDKQEVINTLTEIPAEMWSKKGILPYRVNKVRLETTETTELIEGIEVKELEVVDTIFDRYTEKTLEQIKISKLSEFKSVHQQIKSEGFTSSLGIKIDCEDNNLNDFANNKLLLDVSGASGTKVIDYDNNSIDMNKDDYTILVLELGSYIMNLLNDKQTLRTLVNNSTTKEEVESIYWRNAIMDEDTLEVLSYEYNEVL